MTSPPDVQNVPDVWTILEQAREEVLFWPPAGRDRLPNKTRAVVEAIDAALAQRDRFVLVPKEPEESDERERILKLIREELHQYYVSVPLHGCLFIERGHRK